MNPLWKKICADARADRRRLVLTWLALTLSIAGLGIFLDAHAVLIREINRNYRETAPASATIALEEISPELAAAAGRQPGVLVTERRRAIDTRALVDGTWRPLRLFVIEDFSNLRLNTFTPERGAWPPPRGTLLLEHTAGRLTRVATADTILVRSPRGTPTPLNVSGFVRDAGLAPSEQERALYAYATPETAALLGEGAHLDELRLELGSEFRTRAEIVARSEEIAVWLRGQGGSIHEVRVPPPGRHPHQGPMEAVLLSFIGFGAMALLLSAILMATTLHALLAKQVREIATLKALGAGRGQIARVYLALAAAIGLAAVLVAVPLGLVTARGFAAQIATLINFTLVSTAVPHPVLLTQVVAGIALPVLAALLPIVRAVNLPVRVGLSDHGVSTPAKSRSLTKPSLFATTRLSLWILAWRSTLRRRGRLALSLLLLAAGGAILLSAFNLRSAWETIIARVYAERSYDAVFQLRTEHPADQFAAHLATLPEISQVEFWRSTPVAWDTPNGIPIVAIYPDGAHGSFTLYGTPALTQMVAFPVVGGRWLADGDKDTVVLNHAAHAARPHLKVGDKVRLNAEGDRREWTIVGFVEEVGSAAAAYVPLRTLAAQMGSPGAINQIRVSLRIPPSADRIAAIRQVESALEAASIRVSFALPLTELKTAMGAHITVLINTLIAAAVVMGAVAGLGLSAMLSMSVIERTREFGMLRAIGATPRAISRVVFYESLAVGATGLAVALPLSLAISMLMGRIVGLTAFQLPLPILISGAGLAVCVVGLLGLVLLAAVVPARQAARLPVRIALTTT